ncbi:hypothetical protein BD410DRAFT_242536 [Rickenella mellea]|uniref:Uncharacterized protein n=1 Tax=Rickenella mellea TaxID=50990 RepID=A0A4Y7QP83_9AGAM|nr:hypothetical protein BD410DRAFT_242536 [Rickenella mellea]
MFSKRKANTDWKRGVTQNTSSGVLELPTIVNSHSLKRDPQTGTDWRPRQEKVAHPKREAEAGTDWKRNAAANTDWKRGTDWRRDAARLGSISS